MQSSRLAILGVGLLGGSIGLAVKAAGMGYRVVGYGHRRATLEGALAMGVIDEAFDTAAQAARDADLVILCTPVGMFETLLDEIGPTLKRGIVTDVGSTKRSVVLKAEATLPGKVHFVGSHPMAGSEKRGVEFARADLFKGTRCIVTPTDRSDSGAVEAVEEFWQKLGMRTIRMSPEEHDRLICEVSHLPHAVAAALVAMQSEESLPLAGMGFLDTTRVAGGDGGLWRDILLDNRDNVAAAVARLREKLDQMLEMLQPQKAEELRRWLDAAADRRAKLLAAKLKELHAE